MDLDENDRPLRMAPLASRQGLRRPMPTPTVNVGPVAATMVRGCDDRGQCGQKKAGIFGCRFDASGKPTTCGRAEVKEESGMLAVAVKK
jgi:hypothetical protein